MRVNDRTNQLVSGLRPPDNAAIGIVDREEQYLKQGHAVCEIPNEVFGSGRMKDSSMETLLTPEKLHESVRRIEQGPVEYVLSLVPAGQPFRGRMHPSYDKRQQ